MSADQSEVIEFLSRPSTHGGQPVERIETHASIVFLAGARALKLKRAVRYAYLDFSTVDRRGALCAAEVRLNRRTAPALYRGTVAVRRARDGRLALGGSGEVVDWLVDMRRFDQEGLFDRLAARNALPLELMSPLAEELARFHACAEPRPEHGGVAGAAWVIDGNAEDFARFGAGLLDAERCEDVTLGARRAVELHSGLLDARRAAGRVRQCHGDLHLRNIVLVDGHPTLFDGVEFNDAIACIDVLYDLAFLVMDLWRRSLHRHANAVANGYLARADEVDGLPLLPLFLSCRAAIRAKTSVSASRLQSDLARRMELEDLARNYLALAQQLLRPAPPVLIAIGGLSGSGKSVLSQALAPWIGAVPGAVHLRSDELRKQLCGVGRLERLGPEGYTDEISRRVYLGLAERAARIVRAGQAALLDAVFARPEDRRAIERAASQCRVPFAGLWLEAPEAVLAARVTARAHDPSDADAAVVRRQLAQDVGPMDWQRLDATADMDLLSQRARELLVERLARRAP